jgi:hypothetical protein
MSLPGAPLTPFGLAAMMAVAGILFGLLYFAALRRSVALIAGRGGWLGALALTLARLGAAGAFLFGTAKLGAVPLLAAFAGFLLARAVALRSARRAG